MKTKLIIILSALVLALSGFMLYDSINNEMSQAEIQTQLSDLKSEYEFIQKDLEIAVTDVQFSNAEIVKQKKRIEILFSKSNISQEELLEAKKIMKDISRNFLNNYKEKVKLLEGDKIKLTEDNLKMKDENLKMKDENTKITQEISKINEQVVVLDQKVKKEKNNSEKKDQLISYASRLSLSNFLLRSFKVRNNGKEVETDKASKIDRIKVSFDINENLLADSGDKLIYMVIKKPSGETATFSNKNAGAFNYNNKKINYSDKTIINYVKGKEQNLEFVWDSEDFSRGDYIMEVYEQTKNNVVMIGKVTKSLD